MCTSVPLISRFLSTMNYGALYSWISVISRIKSTMNYGDTIVDFRSHLGFIQWWKMKLFARQHATCRFQTCAHCWNAAQSRCVVYGSIVFSITQWCGQVSRHRGPPITKIMNFQKSECHTWSNINFLSVKPFLICYMKHPHWCYPNMHKYMDADKSLARPGRKQATSMPKSSRMMSYSAIYLAEIRRSPKIRSWIWWIISGVVGLRTYQHPGKFSMTLHSLVCECLLSGI
jgi:hypothetical protein